MNSWKQSFTNNCQNYLSVFFSDLSTNAQTKEEYLTKGCQSRIRGYLAKAESGIKSKLQFDDIFTQFRHSNPKSIIPIKNSAILE